MNTSILKTSVFRLMLSKLEGILLRGVDVFKFLPIRLSRIGKHLWYFLKRMVKHPRSILEFQENLFWLAELFCYFVDVFGLGEIYESLADIVKFNTRPLLPAEVEKVEQIFGKTLNTNRIRIDESAFLGPRTKHFAYVSFYTINYWGDLSDDMFIHELVHIWQYKQLGSVYIPRALKAQFSSEGYDYGGLANLVLAIRSGRGLKHFNVEQQGDIIADYYRILSGNNPRWSVKSPQDLWVFEHLIGDLKHKTRA
jgi:hypothetical protein